jgi:hypothetical protein
VVAREDPGGVGCGGFLSKMHTVDLRKLHVKLWDVESKYKQGFLSEFIGTT